MSEIHFARQHRERGEVPARAANEIRIIILIWPGGLAEKPKWARATMTFPSGVAGERPSIPQTPAATLSTYCVEDRLARPSANG